MYYSQLCYNGQQINGQKKCIQSKKTDFVLQLLILRIYINYKLLQLRMLRNYN